MAERLGGWGRRGVGGGLESGCGANSGMGQSREQAGARLSGSSLRSATDRLCDHEQVPQPLCASLPPGEVGGVMTAATPRAVATGQGTGTRNGAGGPRKGN